MLCAFVAAVDTFWDHRVRHHYGERFDFRKNLIDWDYQEHVRPACGWIHPVLFRDWRTKGLAFEFGDETYTQPNRTLSSYTEVSRPLFAVNPLRQSPQPGGNRCSSRMPK
jgi:dynein assembly factor 3